MQQTSAQGIASLYRGNPAPLQQRIQQEQQAKPGLPPDLQELIALNIVTNEEDAMARQQALSQLNQMQGQQGKPPTVLASVQEQARQKMQAQQQQAMQAMMQQSGPGAMPPGMPQPEAQPQGLDELPVNFEMAGGGIVAFNGEDDSQVKAKYETPYDRMNRENREDAERPERKKDNEGILKALAFLSAPLAAAGDVVAAPFRGLYGLTQHGDTSLTPLMDKRARFLGSSENAPAAEAFTREEKPAARTAADNRSAINASDAGTRSAPAPKPAADLKALANLKALADQKRRQQGPTPVAAAPTTVEQPVTPEQKSNALQRVESRLDVDPNAAREAEEALRLRKIGAPDTSVQDRMIAELEKRKAQLEGPQEGFGRLMEYLGHIAATPRGMSSLEAGAAGAANMRKAQQARQLEQFELSKQALEVSQKKLDTVRLFATEQYNVGKARFDQVYKEEFEAAKALVTDEREAKKLAQENTLKRLEIDSAERRNAATNATTLQAARISAASRENAAGGLSANQRAQIADKALDNVNASLKTNMRLQMEVGKNPALMQQLLAAETSRLMAAATGTTIPEAPGAASPGGTRPPLSSFQR